MSRAWFLATPLTHEVAQQGRATIELLRSDAPDREKAEFAFGFIYETVEHSMSYHFLKPLAELGIGTMTRKALGMALDLAIKGIKSPMRRILNGMDAQQLRGVADAIEHRLYPDPHG